MQGELIYALIVRDRDTILSSYSKYEGSHTRQITDVLRQVRQDRPCEALLIDRFQFIVMNEHRFSYICMTTNDYQNRIARSFLASIRDHFVKSIAEKDMISAVAFSLDKTLQPFLKKQVNLFNTTECDQLVKTQASVDQATEIMQRSLQDILNRGERIEVIVQKAGEMQDGATVFRREATKLKRRMWWRNWGLKIGIGLAVLLLIYIIIGLTCAWDFKC